MLLFLARLSQILPFCCFISTACFHTSIKNAQSNRWVSLRGFRTSGRAHQVGANTMGKQLDLISPAQTKISLRFPVRNNSPFVFHSGSLLASLSPIYSITFSSYSNGTAAVCLHIKRLFAHISEVNKWDWDSDCKLKSFLGESSSLIGKKRPSEDNYSQNITLFVAQTWS